MDEYISREATIDAIKEIYCPQCNNYNGAMCRACEHMDDMDIIEDMPAIDVQPVVHAYWLGIGKKFSEDWTCSNCMRAKGKDSSTNFCSYCGADMRGNTNG